MENGSDHQQRAVEYVEIELDRPRKLVLDHNACALAERTIKRMTGDWLPLPQILARVRLGGMNETIALLWAALLHDDPELTHERTGEILSSKPLEYVVGKLSESIDRYFPNPKEDTEASSPDPTSPRTAAPTG